MENAQEQKSLQVNPKLYTKLLHNTNNTQKVRSVINRFLIGQRLP
ncbi:hypothetical protein [Rodentibacter pneumotropicus]|nr:hypothetical protein [Rodentibacter pneumotropicus]